MKIDKDYINQQIGENLRQTRIDFGENQTKFAKRLGFSQKQYSKIEAGQRRFRVAELYEWARLLRLDALDLLNGISAEKKKGKK